MGDVGMILNIVQLILFGLIIITIILLVYLYVYGYYGDYDFDDLNSLFSITEYAFWEDSFATNFGLKSSDYVKIQINIRTEDAEGDCNISGKLTAGEIRDLKITGAGEKCSDLRIK